MIEIATPDGMLSRRFPESYAAALRAYIGPDWTGRVFISARYPYPTTGLRELPGQSWHVDPETGNGSEPCRLCGGVSAGDDGLCDNPNCISV